MKKKTLKIISFVVPVVFLVLGIITPADNPLRLLFLGLMIVTLIIALFNIAMN